MADHPVYQSLKAGYCYLNSVDSVISDGPCQADLAHWFDFYLSKYGKDSEVACGAPVEEGAKCYYNAWSDQFYTDDAKGVAKETFAPEVDFVMTCPDPRVYSTGSHRSMVGIWYEGERYTLAFEEGTEQYEEHVFIASDSPEGRAKIADSALVIDVIRAAVMSVGGKEVNPLVHKFVVHSVDDSAWLIMQGCTDSPFIYKD